MAASYLDLEIAKRKLQLKTCTAFVSFVTTLWKGEIVMCSYSHVNNSLVGIFSNHEFDAEETSQLEKLIKENIFD